VGIERANQLVFVNRKLYIANYECKGKRMKFVILISVLIIIAGFGCRENAVDPGGGKGPEFLTAEDVGVTDVWLRIKLPFSRTQQPVTLKRDTTTIFHSTITVPDTLILDECLLPNHIYTYTLISYIGSKSAPEAHITITTMDTTSHNFTWEVDTLGDGNSSVLYDVAIINDTCAWAVGEIYKKDSLGQFETEMYNMAKWNGSKWTLSKAYFYFNSIRYVTQLYSICAFSENDIWVGTAGPYHWDGISWKTYAMAGIFIGRVNKFWGTSSTNLYMVGANGSIAHYNGTSWEKVGSETDVDLTDVWGTPDGSIVWVCGWENLKPTVLLKIQNNRVEKVYEDYDHRGSVRGDTISGVLASGMVKDNNLFLYSLAGVYQSPLFNQSITHRLSFTSALFSTMPQRMDGNSRNDFTIVGYSAFIAHFNGYSWCQYTEIWGSNRYLRSVTQKGNIVAVVGVNYDPVNSTGLVLTGRR
jgi:hypothetical protein